MLDGGTNQPAPLAYNGTIYLANTGGLVQGTDHETFSVRLEAFFTNKLVRDLLKQG